MRRNMSTNCKSFRVPNQNAINIAICFDIFDREFATCCSSAHQVFKGPEPSAMKFGGHYCVCTAV